MTLIDDVDAADLGRSTVSAPASDGEPAEAPVRPKTFQNSDLGELAGAVVSSFALNWLVYTRLTSFSGAYGFIVLWFMLFCAIYWAVERHEHGPVTARDRLAAAVIAGVGIGLLVPLALIVGYTIYRGWQAFAPQFFTQDLRTVGSLDAGDAGGGRHAIIGTLEQVGLAMLISVPLGITTAVFLNEIGGRLARPVRLVVDAMSGVPSIVTGLFIYAALIIGLGGEQGGFPAALALSILMLPTVTRTAEVVLRLVPGGLREASLALGGTEWRTTRQVVLPTARSGLATAVILAIARVIGETAPLLLTAGGAFIVNWNPFSEKQDALPFFVYRNFRSSQEAQVDRAWTGAMVLLFLVLFLFVLARVIGGQGPGHIGRLKRRRLKKRGLLT